MERKNFILWSIRHHTISLLNLEGAEGGKEDDSTWLIDCNCDSGRLRGQDGRHEVAANIESRSWLWLLRSLAESSLRHIEKIKVSLPAKSYDYLIRIDLHHRWHEKAWQSTVVAPLCERNHAPFQTRRFKINHFYRVIVTGMLGERVASENEGIAILKAAARVWVSSLVHRWQWLDLILYDAV